VTRRISRIPRALAAAGLLSGALLLVVQALGTSAASADTNSTALVGEGGSFLAPVTDLLLNTDTGLAPLNPQYSDSNLDNAIADFVGTGPGDFAADFVVSERPLTTTEGQTAATDGRSFSYVPLAATPVAIAVFAVCNISNLQSGNVGPSTFCPDMPLTPAQVGEIFTSGHLNPATTGLTTLTTWSQLTQANGDPIADPNGISQASTLSPSAENSTLMALIDSNPVAKADFDSELGNPGITPRVTSDTPNEIWPFQGLHSYVGGDEGLLGKEMNIEATTNAPSNPLSWEALGPDNANDRDAFPVSAVWTGSPEGTPWNVPTAAIQNAAGKFVGPTEQAAAAAETGTGLTFDTSTNLVTFNADSTDAAAYNNYLMAESYLVVPTSGLVAAKAVKLAQLIRYALGPTGQTDIAVMGAAPDTPAEVTAGLKVAAELDAEAASPSQSQTSSSTTTTTTTVSTGHGGSASPTTTASLASNNSSPSGNSGASGNTGSGGSSPTLANTGSDPLPLVLLGSAVVAVAAFGRRRLRRRVSGGRIAP